MEGSSSNRKIVEVFIETDSESESYCSSEDRAETTETTLSAFEEEHKSVSAEDSENEKCPKEADERDEEPSVRRVSVNSSEGVAYQSPPFSESGFEHDSTFQLYHREGESCSPSNKLAESDTEINFQEVIEVELDINHIGQSTVAPFPLQIETVKKESEVLLPLSPPPTIREEEINDEVSAHVTEAVKPENKQMEDKNSEEVTPQPKPIDPDKEYCFCRQPADTYSMIYCHECLEWFHGECVGITRQKATSIKRFYCPLCIDKNPSRVTIFESRNDKEMVQQVSTERTKERLVQLNANSQARKSKSKKHSRRCGECVACVTETDCKKCRFCRDMTKYGGRGSLRQKCIKRQCLRYSRILYAEDPLSSTQHIFQDDIAAELQAVGISISSLANSSFSTDPSEELSELNMRQTNIDRDGQLLRSFSKDSVSSKATDYPEDSASQDSGAIVQTKKRLASSKKQKLSGQTGGVKGGRQSRGKPVGQKKRTSKAKAKTRPSTSDLDYGEMNLRRRVRQPFSDIFLDGGYFREDPYIPQQCQGPECMFSTRPHSKYCSEECGIQLAMKRIHKYLPENNKLQDGIEPRATTENKKNLKQLENEQTAIKHRLEQLDDQTVAIDSHVQQLSTAIPINEDETEADSDDLTIHCATCSQPVTLKKAMVHFEKCFNRLEGMVSFGSIVKNEGTNIFCDKYDSSQKTYCKRLRVLCPEHTKESKIHPKEVCGCPLESEFPSKIQKSRSYCHLPKKSCTTHYCWEKLRKAEIDQEKLNLYLKLEELSEQSRLNQWQMDCRNSLIAVMLHHTIDHDRDASSITEQQTSCTTDIETIKYNFGNVSAVNTGSDIEPGCTVNNELKNDFN